MNMSLFSKKNFNDFEKIWHYPLDWVEEPNVRRGGFSGVGRLHLTNDQGCEITYYVKKQQFHNYRPHLTPWNKKPTFYREYLNMKVCQKLGIGTAPLVFFAKDKKTERAVLVTEELKGFLDLETILQNKSFVEQNRILQKVVEVLIKLASQKYSYGAFYTKHIYVRPRDFSIRLIDLEKMRKKHTGLILERDLEQLFRHSKILTNAHKKVFLQEISLQKNKVDQLLLQMPNS